MRKVRLGVLALVCAVLLSACALVPVEQPDTLYIDSEQKAEDRMQQIADAVNDHDAAALKAMFSPRALGEATDLDEGLDYLLSLFPNGELTIKGGDGRTAERQYRNGMLTEVLLADYRVSAEGREYSVFFADFTVNEVIDPDNVGLYALGVTPWVSHETWDELLGQAKPFYAWARSIHADEGDETGYPGVYVPLDG